MTQITTRLANRLSVYSNSRPVQFGFRCYLTALQYSVKGKQTYSLGEFKMNLDVSESEAMVLRRLRRFEPEVTDLITSTLSEGDIYLDIGSNKGYHLLEAASVIGSSGSAIGFEPSPENYNDLSKNVELNEFKNISLNNIAVSNESEEVYLSYGDRSGHGQISTSIGDVVVQAVSIDDFIDKKRIDTDRVRVVKIDVEGAEGDVLEGMQQFLKEGSSCTIVVEVHGEADANRLREKTNSYESEWLELTPQHWYFEL